MNKNKEQISDELGDLINFMNNEKITLRLIGPCKDNVAPNIEAPFIWNIMRKGTAKNFPMNRHITVKYYPNYHRYMCFAPHSKESANLDDVKRHIRGYFFPPKESNEQPAYQGE